MDPSLTPPQPDPSASPAAPPPSGASSTAQPRTAPVSRRAAFFAAARSLTQRIMRSNTAQRVANYVRNNKGKLAVDVVAGTAVAYLAHTKGHLGFTGTMATFAAAGAATHIIVHKIGITRTMLGLGAGAALVTKGAVAFSKTDFAKYAVPIAVGAYAAYETWKGGYLPTQPVAAEAVAALVVFGGVAGAVKYGFGTFFKPSIGKVVKGAIGAGLIYCAIPVAVNQLVDNGMMTPDNPSVSVAHNIERTVPFVAPIARDLGPPSGAVVANAFIYAYNSVADAQNPQGTVIQTVAPGTQACASYVPGQPGLLDVKINGTDYYTSSQSWVFDPARPPSNACTVQPAAKPENKPNLRL